MALQQGQRTVFNGTFLKQVYEELGISSNLVELNPTETERKSYEIANGFAAGQRTVFNGTFLQEVADQLRSTSALRGLLYIGIPKDPIHTTEVMGVGDARRNFKGPFFRLGRKA